MFAHSYSENSYERANVKKYALMYSSVFSWRRNDMARVRRCGVVLQVARSTLTVQRLQSCVDRNGLSSSGER